MGSSPASKAGDLVQVNNFLSKIIFVELRMIGQKAKLSVY